jgi:hypothetical protein
MESDKVYRLVIALGPYLDSETLRYMRLTCSAARAALVLRAPRKIKDSGYAWIMECQHKKMWIPMGDLMMHIFLRPFTVGTVFVCRICCPEILTGSVAYALDTLDLVICCNDERKERAETAKPALLIVLAGNHPSKTVHDQVIKMVKNVVE